MYKKPRFLYTSVEICIEKAIFQHPYTKIQFLVDANIAKRQTASSYLQTLAGLGVLRSIKQGREMYYINDALFSELVK